MSPTLILSLVAAAIAGSAGFGTAWMLQGRTIDSLKLEQANDRIAQQRAARQTTERLTSTVAAAQGKAGSRDAANRRDADSAGSAGSGLRVASADSTRTTNDLETCARSLTAHGVVLAESIELLQSLAKDADDWASHAVMLQEAWPISSSPSH